MMPCLYIYVLLPSKKKRYILDTYISGWESFGFHQNFGFLMIPGVILEICLNLGRNLYVYMYFKDASC